MSDNLTAQSATPATIPANSVVATHDLGGVGGTGHAQKVVALAPNYVVTGHDWNVTVDTTAVHDGAGITIPANTTHVLISVEAGDIRMGEDGDPTSTQGINLVSGSIIEVPIPSTKANLSFIKSSTSGATAKVNLSYRAHR